MSADTETIRKALRMMADPRYGMSYKRRDATVALAALGRVEERQGRADAALRRFLTDHDTDQLLPTGKRQMCLCPDCLTARAALSSAAGSGERE